MEPRHNVVRYDKMTSIYSGFVSQKEKKFIITSYPKKAKPCLNFSCC